MNRLTILADMGFRISWKLISVGLFGAGRIPPTLTYGEIFDYLTDSLGKNDKQTEDIITLICEEDNLSNFDSLLLKLAYEDTSNVTIQKRKWRAFLLKQILDNISKDYLQGLLELMEFWQMMGHPKDCPQALPHSTAAVQKFFSQQTYKTSIHKNREWLAVEMRDIICEEN